MPPGTPRLAAGGPCCEPSTPLGACRERARFVGPPPRPRYVDRAAKFRAPTRGASPLGQWGDAGLTLAETAVREPRAGEHRSAGRGGDPTDQCCGRHRSGLLGGAVLGCGTFQDSPVDVDPGTA